MTLNEYQEKAMGTCLPSSRNFAYMFYNFLGEVGEMIEKATEWLKENVEKYLYNRGGFEEYIPTCGGKLFTDFKKAMEE